MGFTMKQVLVLLLGVVGVLGMAERQIPVGNSPAPAFDVLGGPLDGQTWECEEPAYKVHLVSRSPLVVYLEDFITEREREALLAAANPLFQKSVVASGNGTGISGHRTSTSTALPPSALVSCLHARALSFQGFSLTPAHLEPLQLVHYTHGQHYHYHTDWFTSPAHTTLSTGGNRASSFFGYVQVAKDMVGGGTRFPAVSRPSGEEWCKWIECDAEWTDGTTFRAVEGNAVYWENLVDVRGARLGDYRTVHAGMPVIGGDKAKVGVNIWTREAAMGKQVRGY